MLQTLVSIAVYHIIIVGPLGSQSMNRMEVKRGAAHYTVHALHMTEKAYIGDFSSGILQRY